MTRRITKLNLEWRIRNLPYPIDVYSVTTDNESRCLIVRTTNKKYYKKIPIPELDRVDLLPQQDLVQFSHKYNTLIINVSYEIQGLNFYQFFIFQYKKPKEVLDLEKAVYEEIMKVEPKNEAQMGDCKPS